MAKITPHPGSPEALTAGCTCPILDNAHGRGYMGVPGMWVVVDGCPLHDPPQQMIIDTRSQKMVWMPGHEPATPSRAKEG